METYEELQKQLDKLYESAPSRAQRIKINKLKGDYQDEAAGLVLKYMEKEIEILSDIKIALSN